MNKPRIEIPDLVEDMARVEAIRFPVLKVYQTDEGEYVYPSKSFCDKAIDKSIAKKNNTNGNEESSILLVEPLTLLMMVQILPMSQRKRRQRRGERP